jgi:hypothetical protein
VWAHVKHSLANLAVVALDRLETLVRNRLKRLQYRPDTLDDFIAGAGLTLDNPTSPWRAEVSKRWDGQMKIRILATWWMRESRDSL